MTETKSLKQLAKKVKFTSTYGASLNYDQRDEWQQNANDYRCTIKYHGRQYSFDFFQGIGCQGDPTAEGCLDCLLSDANGAGSTFEDFCSEFGYDTDSRKAERIYNACRKIRENLERLFGDDFETFLYADRN